MKFFFDWTLLISTVAERQCNIASQLNISVELIIAGVGRG
jgi:hypothetical protein